MTVMEQTRKLKVSDRCDRCGVQAWILVKGVSGELYFCGHDFAKNEEALYNWAYDIVDEREFINEKSQSSA